jgi:hypothetical protein
MQANHRAGEEGGGVGSFFLSFCFLSFAEEHVEEVVAEVEAQVVLEVLAEVVIVRRIFVPFAPSIAACQSALSAVSPLTPPRSRAAFVVRRTA